MNKRLYSWDDNADHAAREKQTALMRIALQTARLEALRARERKWITRSKRAKTALTKIRRSIKRYKKVLARASKASTIVASTA